MGRPCLCCCPSCEQCITFEQFEQDYDYGLLICNVNAAKDDEFNLYLNDIFFGNVSELGEDQCKGKWFITSDDVINKIINSKDNPCNDKNIQPPICCYENTTSKQLLNNDQKKSFFYENFKVFLKNTKNNRNGNFGYIGIWRVKKNTNSVCQIATDQYIGFSGTDLTIDLLSSQNICCPCDELLNNGGLVVNLEYNSTGIPHTSPEELLFLFNPAGFSTTKLNPCNLNLSSDHVLCSDIYSPPINVYGCDDQFYDNWTFLESKISSEAISPNNFSPPETRYRECHYRGLALYQGFSTPPQYLERDAYLYKNFAPFFANCDIYYFFIYRFFVKLNKIENIINVKNTYNANNSFQSNIIQTKNFYHTYGILTYSASYVKNYRWKLVESIGFGGQYTGYYLPETPLESTWRIAIGSNPSTQFPYDYNGLFSCSQCMGTDLNSSYSETQVLNSGQRISIYPYQINRILHKSASQVKNYQFFQNCQCENLLEIMQLDLANTDYTNYLFEWPQGSFSNNVNIESSVLNTFDLNNVKMKYITKNPNDLF